MQVNTLVTIIALLVAASRIDTKSWIDKLLALALLALAGYLAYHAIV